MKKLKVGIIGLGQRGSGLLHTALNCSNAEVVAICDRYADRVEKAKKAVEEKGNPTPVCYDDYRTLLAEKKVEAVIISTSWEAHVRMAIDAMKAGIPTGLEVSGAYDIEDCWQLVRCYEETRTPIMFLENCCFDKFELLTTSLVRNGALGTVVYCHGAYGHDLREEILGGNVNRHYRLENYKHRNCDNYPTHEIGPIAKLLNVNRGNRLVSLTSMASKSVGLKEFAVSEKNPDKSLVNEEFKQGDIVVTTISCANGEVITLRLDTTLPRFYSRQFTVSATKGLCMQETNAVLIEKPAQELEEIWKPAEAVKKHLNSGDNYSEYLPDAWKNMTPEAIELGHGGMDFIELTTFFDAVLEGKEMPIDVYDAALWMSITPLTEQSIALGGAPVMIPDFTRGEWHLREAKDVVELPKINKRN